MLAIRLCQDPTGSSSSGDHKERQPSVVWPYLHYLAISHLAIHSKRGKETGREREEVTRQHQAIHIISKYAHVTQTNPHVSYRAKVTVSRLNRSY